jgi:hypothetical protein
MFVSFYGVCKEPISRIATLFIGGVSRVQFDRKDRLNMHEWTDGRTDRRTDGPSDGEIGDGKTERRADGWIDIQRVERQADLRVFRLRDGQTYLQKDR